MHIFKLILVVSLFGITFPAAAAEQGGDKPDAEKMTQLLKSRLGGADVGEIKETPIKGLYQTRFGSKFAYLSDNGRYVVVGDMIDLEAQVNLTEVSRRGIAKDAIGAFPIHELVVYPASGQQQAVLNVFTDTSCPYCKKLHEEVPQLQKAGIEVRYFPFPRGGDRGPGYNQLRQVWCGQDRNVAMDIMKGVQDGELGKSSCEGAVTVDRGYELGNKIGVAGTPALFTETGYKIEGYVPYNQLIPMVLSGAN